MSKRKNFEVSSEALAQKQKSQIKRPPMFQVFLLNDDYTPMDFVVDVLTHFFYLDEATATKIMLTVHHEGKGICGIYTHDIAETKVQQVNQYARACEFPLLCQMEQL